MTATDMKIAERIQQLRKSKGLSQEQLAAQLDVSRQAVSKWESGQSVPELDKIILMSNLFETTTDYLLKGVEPTAAPKHRCNAILFSGAGTIINGMGLIIAWMVWVERQTAYAVGIGLILMLLGTGLFLAGQVVGGQHSQNARQVFILPNVWILSFIPFCCVFNILDGLAEGYTGLIAPVPMMGVSIPVYVICCAGYLAACCIADVVLVKKMNKGIR